MYSIGVKHRFAAAHKLVGNPGKCGRLHGHSWEVEAVFAGEPGEDGMVLDFEIAKRALSRALEQYDHTCLNEVPPFDTVPPTAENVARAVFDRLESDLAAPGEGGAALVEVTVWESVDSRATYAPGG